MTILSVFMIVALTAVGFAAWLIVGTIDAETTGSFVSNELQDKYFKVEVEFAKANADDKNGQIIFGAPDGDSAGKWLTYKNTDAKENLSAVATIKFTPDAGFDLGTETMEYYLEDASGNQRTIRVAIDIAEIFDEETEEQKSEFYKWFDWAVELGYVQYPTVEWITNSTEPGAENKKFAWNQTENAKQNFQNGQLVLDLNASMFTIDENDKFATAQIKITFDWGKAVSKTETVDSVIKTTYYNPYTFFNGFEPEEKVDVAKYLKITGSGDSVTYALAATTAVVEGDTDPTDNNQIRYKDLAQRMLDYLYNYLNYEAAVYDGETLETPQKGIQFSITLSEGEVIEVTNL